MKIFIENKVLEYSNSISHMDKIWEDINKEVEFSSKFLSHMLIDGVEIYENIYDYILDNIKYIEEIKVITLTYKELIDDILATTLDYLERTPTLIDNLADKFYREPTKDAWEELNGLLGSIGWIITTFKDIDNNGKLKDIVISYEGWNLYAKEVHDLTEVLSELEEALVNNDSILIGDILSYEIAEKFNDMKARLIHLVQRKENLNDLN